ncbi:MAG: PAS domain-containing protein [Bacteroidetes bacterium]|nr:PAS domain-containing protein [Bacteroidota bacterium]
MNVEDMDRDALLEEVSRLQRQIAGLREGARQLEHQLQTRDREIIKVKNDLQNRIAEAICRENDLRRNQDRFRTLVANIPGAVYRCANDAFWTMEFMSEQIEEISGYPASEFIGNAVRSYKSIVHPEDVIKVINAVNDSLNARIPYMIDYRIKHRDGSIRQVYERGTGVHTEDGTLLWLDGVIFDQLHRPARREDPLPEW